MLVSLNVDLDCSHTFFILPGIGNVAGGPHDPNEDEIISPGTGGKIKPVHMDIPLPGQKALLVYTYA